MATTNSDRRGEQQSGDVFHVTNGDWHRLAGSIERVEILTRGDSVYLDQLLETAGSAFS